MFDKTGALKHLAKFTGKNCVAVSFYNSNLKDLIKEPTSFKSVSPICSDLINNH